MSSLTQRYLSVLLFSFFLLLAAGCGSSSGSGSDGGSTDTTPPVISVNPPNPLDLNLTDPYVEYNATATDNVDGNLTASIVIDSSDVNTSAAGTYIVTYTVSDKAGNTAVAERTVNVVDPDAPVITLLGNNPYYLNVGDTYFEPGATATDLQDDDVALTASIEVNATDVNTSAVGSYTVIYTVTDSDAKTATAERTVVVIDPAVGVIYEDAEDGTTDGWNIYDDNATDPAFVPSIANVFDADLGSNVILLDGNETEIGFELPDNLLPGWNDTDHKILEMDMKYVSDRFKIYVKCLTAAGQEWVVYANYAQPASDTNIWVDVTGSFTGNTWEHFSSSTLGDIETKIIENNATNQLLEIDGIRIKASMSVDNIILRN